VLYNHTHRVFTVCMMNKITKYMGYQMTEQEKKQRISELRAELKELQSVPKSDWHTAFEAFLKFKMHKYKGITIQTEVEIGTDAPRTDYLIITEEETQEFEESIFKIFRKINIIEYKNPHDTLNERVIYKIIGYADLLIGTAEHEDDVPPDDVTISIFRAAKNRELFNKLEKSGNLINTGTPGIYYVIGLTKLPFQIVITGELEGKENASARALTDNAKESDIENVISELQDEQDSGVREYYRMFLSMIAEKNPIVFEEIRRINSMNPGRMIVFEDEMNKRLNEALLKKEKETTLETTVDHLSDIMSKLKYSVGQAMDLLSIPQDQRETYAKLIEQRA